MLLILYTSITSTTPTTFIPIGRRWGGSIGTATISHPKHHCDSSTDNADSIYQAAATFRSYGAPYADHAGDGKIILPHYCQCCYFYYPYC